MEHQMRELQARLEELRRRHVEHRLEGDEVLAVMEQAGRLRKQAEGSPMEGTLDVILDLLRSTWQTCGTQEELRDCRRMLAGMN